MNTKQVLIWRDDLKVRTGKKMAQSAHAGLAWLTRRIQKISEQQDHDPDYWHISNLCSEAEWKWINGSFAKVVLAVDNENDLLQIYKEAKEAGIITELIVDSGLTEFDGVPTATCVGIGPDYADKIDALTGKDSEWFKSGRLRLY